MIDLIQKYKNNINALESNPLNKVLKFMLECADHDHAIYYEEGFLGKATTVYHVKIYLYIPDFANEYETEICTNVWNNNTIEIKIKAEEWFNFYKSKVIGQSFAFKNYLYVFKEVNYSVYSSSSKYINYMSYIVIKYNPSLKEKNHE